MPVHTRLEPSGMRDCILPYRELEQAAADAFTDGTKLRASCPPQLQASCSDFMASLDPAGTTYIFNVHIRSYCIIPLDPPSLA